MKNLNRLKYYIGKKVKYYEEFFILRAISTNEDDIVFFDLIDKEKKRFNIVSGSDLIIPVLKTVDQLHKDNHSLSKYIDCFSLLWVGVIDYKCVDLLKVAKTIETLINDGYGATPNDESPTGYVDLFGNPCVAEDGS